MNTDTAMNVLESAMNTCGAIRRDAGWTQSADAPARHAHILRDLEVNFVPLCDDAMTAVVMAGAIAGEREAFSATR